MRPATTRGKEEPGAVGVPTGRACRPSQYTAREGHHHVPRAHAQEITVEGGAAPVSVKLGVRITNTKSRRHKLTDPQRTALTKLGIDWVM
jgi:hypothetical protein